MESKDFRNLMESAQNILKGELNEYKGEYDPEYEHSMIAHDQVQRAEGKKGKKLTSQERKHIEDKVYHDIGYRDGHGRQMEKAAGRKLSYAEMLKAKADHAKSGVEESLSDKTLHSYINKADPEVARVKYGDAKHTPKTNRRARGVNKARARLLAPDELAISPERIADTRKNIEKFLNRKRK